MKITKHDKPYFVWVHGVSGPVKSFLTFKVQPQTHRYYDAEKGLYALHVDHLVDLVKIGEFHLGFVDYSDLGVDLQMYIAQGKSGRSQKKTIPQDDPFAVMHLLPSAPQSIIEAAWKALAKLHHPDMGGDEETFKRIADAYSRIKENGSAPKGSS